MAQDNSRLLTPTEVAVMFKVTPKTVTRWAETGKLSSTRTLGGHRRFYEAEVAQLQADEFEPREE
jgi:excisionase family DNA binding protein